MVINIDNLNSIHIDVLKEVGNIGSGNAATALAKILNKKVEMNVPKVKVLEFREVSDILGGAEIVVTGILLRVTSDLEGNIMFILRLDEAKNLVGILMNRKLSEDASFDELEMSALMEVGDILAGSYLSALSTLTRLRIMPSVPVIAIDMAGAIVSVPAIEFSKIGDTVLYIETEFIDGESRVVGDFFLVPELDSYDKLLRALGVITDG